MSLGRNCSSFRHITLDTSMRQGTFVGTVRLRDDRAFIPCVCTFAVGDPGAGPGISFLTHVVFQAKNCIHMIVNVSEFSRCKHTVAKCSQTSGEYNFAQRPAESECCTANFGNTFRDDNFFQTVALFKCICTDARDSVGNGNICEMRKCHKGIIINGRDAFLDNDMNDFIFVGVPGSES